MTSKQHGQLLAMINKSIRMLQNDLQNDYPLVTKLMIKSQIKDLEEVVWELKLSYHSIVDYSSGQIANPDTVDDPDKAQLSIN